MELSGMTIPRALALTLALLQLAVIASVIVTAVRRRSAPPLSDEDAYRGGVSRVALLVIGASALVVVHRFGGPSAAVWPDTFNDQAEVQRCLEHSECTVYGMGTSVPGFVHACGWLQLRDLLSALGIAVDRQYLLMQVLDALGVMLATLVAWRLSGPLAAGVATWAVWNHLGMVGIAYHALYNSILMPFLGAVFLAACAEAIERPGTWSVVAAALTGAILANVHFTGVACGFTAVWIGLLAPRRRLSLAATGAATFALGALAVSPATWLHSVAFVVGHSSGERHQPATMALFSEPAVADGVWVAIAWIATLIGGERTARLRRRLDAPIAIVVPSLAMFLLAGLSGRISPYGKYIAHLRAPVAVALGTIAAAVASTLVQIAAERSPRRAARMRTGFAAVTVAAPYLGAAMLLLCQPPFHEVLLRLEDTDAAARVLRDDLGWDFARAVRSLKSPNSYDVLSAWKVLFPQWVGRSTPSAEDDGLSAVLLHVRASDLPDPLPREWRILTSAGSEVALLAVVPSWVDWRRFAACRAGGEVGTERCVATGLVERPHPGNAIEVAGMPEAGQITPGEVLRLRLPLRAAPAGGVHEVFMPRHPGRTCPGRITAVPEGSRLDPDGRRATLVLPAVGDLVLEWEVGDCQAGYSGLPPFFLEGDAETVRPLAELLTRSWEQ
jgi:hypothetical protein